MRHLAALTARITRVARLSALLRVGQEVLGEVVGCCAVQVRGTQPSHRGLFAAIPFFLECLFKPFPCGVDRDRLHAAGRRKAAPGLLTGGGLKEVVEPRD
jgi:hypothetical protein